MSDARFQRQSSPLSDSPRALAAATSGPPPIPPYRPALNREDDCIGLCRLLLKPALCQGPDLVLPPEIERQQGIAGNRWALVKGERILALSQIRKNFLAP